MFSRVLNVAHYEYMIGKQTKIVLIALERPESAASGLRENSFLDRVKAYRQSHPEQFVSSVPSFLGNNEHRSNRSFCIEMITEAVSDIRLNEDALILVGDMHSYRFLKNQYAAANALKCALITSHPGTAAFFSELKRSRNLFDYLIFTDLESCVFAERQLRGQNSTAFCKYLPADDLDQFFAGLGELRGPDIYLTALHLSHGGTEMAIASLANAFVRRGYAVRIIASYALGEPAYRIDERVEIQYLSFDRPNRRELRRARDERKLFCLLRELIKALAILHRKKKNMRRVLRRLREACLIISRKEQALLLRKHDSTLRTILHLHYDPQSDSKLIKRLDRYTCEMDAIVLLTPDYIPIFRNRFKEQGVVARKEIKAIGNFLPNREALALPNERKRQIITAARLEYEKGIDRLLDVWSMTDRGDYKLLIAGDGREKENLTQRAITLDIADSVEFLGFLPHDELENLMACSRLYVLPSRFEGFGLVLLEAAACGLPLVAFDIPGGPGLLIKEDENGYLCPDIPDMADTISKLLHDDERCSRLARASLRLAEAYREDKVLPEWLELIT